MTYADGLPAARTFRVLEKVTLPRRSGPRYGLELLLVGLAREKLLCPRTVNFKAAIYARVRRTAPRSCKSHAAIGRLVPELVGGMLLKMV